ncbi:ARM repeat-containing protein [Xylona heveae TC161]|uniref:Nucleolar protein 9 n=1 Tax=Xylona heveae (strain CBS 132557 / TC161) TaxID=1328760 RepID=A0A165GL90_XYLHT|nr:ARM repeat-containing protein [Xylona heveae TC161]KZF22328.1 ARM repeat-containing protein [Xylona heveae TC161]
MPKENKKRGRREEKKRKLEEEEAVESAQDTKRQKPEVEPDFLPLNDAAPAENGYEEGGYEEGGSATETPFYGLLDEEEQEYFKRADELLDLNQFNDAEERNLFLANVYREAEGKELKIASSQSCSRLMERLILLSNPAQLKALFGKFSGNFLHLVQHRFASHCCETLFIRSAPVVTQELIEPPDQTQEDETTGEVFVTMENLFLYTLNELEGNLGYLVMDRFASHTIRVLLVVLSGKPLMKRSTTSVVQSRKKENITVTGMPGKPTDLELDERSVPESFTAALDKMIKDTIAGLDTNHLRALATHPTGNPVLQLLLELELSQKPGSRKQKVDEQYLFKKLLPDDLSEENTDSTMFFNSMIYDPLGSRVLEAIIRVAPGKTFKAIYRHLLKERIGSLARNDIAGFVAMRALERLSKEDLQDALQSILPQIPSLVERSRTTVIRTLVERCGVRGADTKALANALKESYGGDGDDVDPAERLAKMLKLDLLSKKDANGNANLTAEEKAQQLHGSLLAQAMLNVPHGGPLSEFVQAGLLVLASSSSPSSSQDADADASSNSENTFIKICEDPVLSRVVQQAFNPSNPSSPDPSSSSNPSFNPSNPSSSNYPSSSTGGSSAGTSTSSTADTAFRRKLLPKFYTHIAPLACTSAGSHVIDSLWPGSRGLPFIRDQIAAELARDEPVLRESFFGRAVWRNWMMDMYKRRRGDWVALARAQHDPDDDDASVPDNLSGAGAGSYGRGRGGGGGQGYGHGRGGGGGGGGYSRGGGHGYGSSHATGNFDNKGRGGKTGIEKARERFAAEKAKKEKMNMNSQKKTGTPAESS